MALILDLWCGYSLPLVAEDEIVEVLLIVDLSHDLSQALGSEGTIFRFHWADTETLAKEQLLAECSCDSLAYCSSSSPGKDR